ncbi:nSTAND1 domain-containing NTPase [Nocardia goodfellowii]
MSPDRPAPDQQNDSVATFKADLQQLRGAITYKAIAAATHSSAATCCRVATGVVLSSWETTKPFIAYCLQIRHAGSAEEPSLIIAELKRWEDRWKRLSSPSATENAQTEMSARVPLPDTDETTTAAMAAALERLRQWSGMSVRATARATRIAKTTLADKLAAKSALTADEVYRMAFAFVSHRDPDDAERIATLYARAHSSTFVPRSLRAARRSEEGECALLAKVSGHGTGRRVGSGDPDAVSTREGLRQALTLQKRGLPIRTIAKLANVSNGTAAGWFSGLAVPRADSREFREVLRVLGIEDPADYHRWVLAVVRVRNAEKHDPSPVSPYRPYQAFGDKESGAYCARPTLTRNIARRVVSALESSKPQLLVITGTAGAGKSSLVSEGLVRELGPGTTTEVVRLTAYQDPAREVIDTLTSLNPIAAGQRLVLVIDQAELLVQEPQLGRTFAVLLERLGWWSRHHGCAVVIAVRTDCRGRWLEQNVMKAVPIDVTEPTDTELHEMIVRPAEVTGVHVDARLASLLKQEILGHPHLPPAALVTLVMGHLWRSRRSPRQVTAEDYLFAGGIRAALAANAEMVYTAGIDVQRREVARRILLRAVDIGDSSAMGRIIPPGELEWDDFAPEIVSGVLNILTAGRLLVITHRGIQLSSDELIPGWPRIAEWTRSRRTELRRIGQLARAAAEWDAAGRAPDHLLSPAQTAELLEWPQEARVRISRREMALLSASATHHAVVWGPTWDTAQRGTARQIGASVEAMAGATANAGG